MFHFRWMFPQFQAILEVEEEENNCGNDYVIIIKKKKQKKTGNSWFHYTF